MRTFKIFPSSGNSIPSLFYAVLHCCRGRIRHNERKKQSLLSDFISNTSEEKVEKKRKDSLDSLLEHKDQKGQEFSHLLKGTKIHLEQNCEVLFTFPHGQKVTKNPLFIPSRVLRHLRCFLSDLSAVLRCSQTRCNTPEN